MVVDSVVVDVVVVVVVEVEVVFGRVQGLIGLVGAGLVVVVVEGVVVGVVVVVVEVVEVVAKSPHLYSLLTLRASTSDNLYRWPISTPSSLGTIVGLPFREKASVW